MNILRETDFGPKVIELLQQHLDSMAGLSPPESVHALDVSGLKNDAVTFWCAWETGNGQQAGRKDEPDLMGCAALKQLDAATAEIKSMKTATAYTRRGVASRLLEQLLTEARLRSYSRLYLETGSSTEFLAAHTLYQRYGFVECPPFADYVLDPHSIFMMLDMTSA